MSNIAALWPLACCLSTVTRSERTNVRAAGWIQFAVAAWPGQQM
jgi:hypothetical protein